MLGNAILRLRKQREAVLLALVASQVKDMKADRIIWPERGVVLSLDQPWGYENHHDTLADYLEEGDEPATANYGGTY